MSLQGAGLPFTDAFKLCHVDQWPRGDFVRTGDARAEVDRAVGRPVVRLAGAFPAANSLQLPRSRAGCLGLAGRFLYIQAQLAASKAYAVHVELVTADKSVQRLSISNLCKQDDMRMKRSGIQVYMPPPDDDPWLLLALDMHALSQHGCGAAFSRVKGVQLCANMAVRTVFSSSLKYDWESLPRDLAFSAAFDTRRARVVWMPEEPTKDVQLPAAHPRPAHPLPLVPRQPQAPQPRLRKEGSRAGLDDVQLSSCDELEGGGSFTLEPTPIMRLQHMNAFSGEFSRAVLWAGGELVFPAGAVIVAMAPGGAQRHLLGHSRPVAALALDGAASVLASVEEGSEGAIKLWNLAQGTCVATLSGHAGGACCLDLSPDGCRLVSAGVDAHGKQVVVLTNISQCSAGGAAVELARCVSDYHLKCLKFLPFDPDKLVACGKNCVRVYRVKEGQLRGVSVPMDSVQALRRPYSCGTLADAACAAGGEVFTDIAFEHDPQLLPAATRRAYVSTFSGALYQVNLDMRAVEAVYQLHAAAIGAVAVLRGFCATGCSKGVLRVWGLDFGEPFMETQLEGPVTGVAFSGDGLSIAVGTEIGSLGVLGMASHKYSTLLRSHTGSVHAVAVEPSGQQFYTASADGTARAWDGATRQQLLEFLAPGERVLCIACHPSRAEVACGFESGVVRVFDVAAAALAQECSQHTGPVRQVLYAHRGHVLLSAGEDGNVCAYDARRAYLPLKYLGLGPGLAATAAAISQDSHTIAVAAARAAGGEHVLVTLFSAASLDPTLQFPLATRAASNLPAAHIAQLHFLSDAQLLLAIMADGRLLGCSCADGSLMARLPALHSGGCTASALDKSGTFLLTGGADGQVCAWGLHALHQLKQEQQSEGEAEVDSGLAGKRRLVKSLPHQAFVAHSAAVLGLAFLSSEEVLSVGAGDSFCFWSFHGQCCNAYPPAPRDATTGTVIIAPLPPAQPPDQLPASAACTPSSSFPYAEPGQEAAGEELVRPASPLQRLRLASSPGALGGSAAGVLGGSGSPAGTLAAPVQSADTAAKGSPGGKRVPFWQRQREGPFTLQVTAGRSARQVQQVPLQPELLITASEAGAKGGGGRGGGGGGAAADVGARSAEWVWQEKPGARIPAFRPEEQLQLLPPTAAVQHVFGFTAAAGFGWDAEVRRVAYAAGNVLVLDDLDGDQQRHLAFLGGDIIAMASSSRGGWAAAAVAPGAAAGAAADILLFDASSGQQRGVLQCHQEAVRELCPSPDGAWLASLGSTPSEPPLALWDAATAELVAVGSCSPAAVVRSLAWLPGAAQPTFFTASSVVLCQWVLGPQALACEQVVLPEAMGGVQLQAVACCGSAQPDGACSLVLGDDKGRAWLLEVSAALDITSFALLAALEGDSVTAAAAAGGAVVLGSAKGTVAVLQQGGGSWNLAGTHQLDGQVLRLSIADPEGHALLAATEASTLWLLRKGAAEALLCGHRHAIAGMRHAAGLLATASLAGVHVWQMAQDGQGGNARAPLVEFCDAADAACVNVAHNGSCAAAGYPNGSVSLYDLPASRLRWRAAALQPHPVVGVAVLERLRAIRVMVVYRNGAIYVLDGATGSVLQHTLQYLAAEPAARDGKAAAPSAAGSSTRGGRSSQNVPVSGLVVCPTDGTLFALLSPSRAVVSKATWAKHSAPQTLGRLQPAGQDIEAPAPTGPPPALAFSAAHPGHAYCAFPSPKHQPATIQLHDYAAGAIIKTIPVGAACGGAITALAVSPGDTLLAAGGASGTVLLLRGETEAWAELAGHGGPVHALAFSHCGTKLFSVAGGAVFVWHIKG